MHTLPPGPDLHPARQLYWFITDPVGLHMEMRARFGNLFTLNLLGQGKTVVFGDPEPVRKIFSDTTLYAPMNEDVLYFFNKPALVFMAGAEHLRRRKLVAPPFRPRRMGLYADAMHRITRRHLDQLSGSGPQSLLRPFKAITLDIILECAFGVTGAEQDALRDTVLDWYEAAMNPLMFGSAIAIGGNRIRHAINTLVARDRPGGWGPLSRLPLKVMADRERVINELITARVERSRDGDDSGTGVLDLLGQARYEDGEPMSKAHIFNEMLSLTIAGYETTATALCWTVNQLYRRPDLVARCRDEIRGVFGDRIDPHRIRELPLLNATIQEALRLNPVNIGMGRRVTRPVELGGCSLPEGITVEPCPWMVHRNAAVWEDAEAFRPERFLERKPLASEYFPFGMGVKMCVAKAFAMAELNIVLAELVLNHHIAFEADYSAFPAQGGVTVSPRGGLIGSVTPRRCETNGLSQAEVQRGTRTAYDVTVHNGRVRLTHTDTSEAQRTVRTDSSGLVVVEGHGTPVLARVTSPSLLGIHDAEPVVEGTRVFHAGRPGHTQTLLQVSRTSLHIELAYPDGEHIDTIDLALADTLECGESIIRDVRLGRWSATRRFEPAAVDLGRPLHPCEEQDPDWLRDICGDYVGKASIYPVFWSRGAYRVPSRLIDAMGFDLTMQYGFAPGPRSGSGELLRTHYTMAKGGRQLFVFDATSLMVAHPDGDPTACLGQVVHVDESGKGLGGDFITQLYAPDLEIEFNIHLAGGSVKNVEAFVTRRVTGTGELVMQTLYLGTNDKQRLGLMGLNHFVRAGDQARFPERFWESATAAEAHERVLANVTREFSARHVHSPERVAV